MESNLRLCKKCNQLKTRIEAGKYPNGKDKKWSDESGKLWNGSTCGLCNSVRSKDVMQKSRTSKKEIING